MSFSSPATTRILGGPTRASTRALRGWLPRPNKKALSADNASDDGRRTALEQFQDGGLAQIAADHPAVPNRIDSQEGRPIQAQYVQDAGGRSAGSEQISPPPHHGSRELASETVEGRLVDERRRGFGGRAEPDRRRHPHDAMQSPHRAVGYYIAFIQIDDFGVRQRHLAWRSKQPGGGDLAHAARRWRKDRGTHLHAGRNAEHRHRTGSGQEVTSGAIASGEQDQLDPSRHQRPRGYARVLGGGDVGRRKREESRNQASHSRSDLAHFPRAS